MPVAETSQEFLRHVWNAQPIEGYAFLSYRDDSKQWHDVPLAYGEWNEEDFELPNGGETVYFCPNLFRKPHRRKEYALPTVWCHADLDEVDPDPLDPPPTAAWQTSPGRFQCLWELRRPVSEVNHARLNQALTYFTGADSGGWSITKALRVPWSTSVKYEDPFLVELMWDGMQRYPAGILWDTVKHVAKQLSAKVEVPDLVLPEMTGSAVIDKHKRELPSSVIKLLKYDRATGDRSAILWKIECGMLKAGVPPEEVLIAVRDSAWNKYRGQRRELGQLWREVNKAKSHVNVERRVRKERKKKTKPPTESNGRTLLSGDSLTQFMKQEIETPQWMVEGVWSDKAHGLIAGEAKTFKSLIAMDLGVAVASGTRFLGHFDTPEQGPVMLIQEENEPSLIQDRLMKIASSRGLLPDARMNGKGTLSISSGVDDIPMWIYNNRGFRLTEVEHLEALQEEIIRIKPKLVILDPLYRMIPGRDENSASEMNPVLGNLLDLKQAHGCGILIIHHYKKQNFEYPSSGGARISGTGLFHRWFESALYVEKTEDPFTVKLVPDHRAAAPQGVITLDFELDDLGKTGYYVEVQVTREERAQNRMKLKRLVNDRPGIRLDKLAEVLESHPKTVKKWCEELGYVVRRGESKGSQGRPPLRVYLNNAK